MFCKKPLFQCFAFSVELVSLLFRFTWLLRNQCWPGFDSWYNSGHDLFHVSKYLPNSPVVTSFLWVLSLNGLFRTNISDRTLANSNKATIAWFYRSYVKTAILMFNGSAAQGGSRMAIMNVAAEKSEIKKIHNSSEVLVSSNPYTFSLTKCLRSLPKLLMRLYIYLLRWHHYCK